MLEKQHRTQANKRKKRQTDRHRHRQTDGQTNRQRDRDREKETRSQLLHWKILHNLCTQLKYHLLVILEYETMARNLDFLVHVQCVITILTAGQVRAIDREPIVALALPRFARGVGVVTTFSS